MAGLLTNGEEVTQLTEEIGRTPGERGLGALLARTPLPWGSLLVRCSAWWIGQCRQQGRAKAPQPVSEHTGCVAVPGLAARGQARGGLPG